MAFQPLLHLLLVSTSLSTVFATSITLTTEVTKFIPQCALGCFASFLDANWLTNTCGSTPSLQCLCAHTGLGGYTIAEGAVECIVAENTLGACQGFGSDSQAVQDAFQMCSGQPNAQPNTHSTLVATLVIPTTGSGIIIIATPTVTAIDSSGVPSTVASFSTISPTSTSATFSSIQTMTVPSSPVSSPPPNITPATTSQPSRSATASATATPAPVLSTGQITGITLGVSGAIGIAIGAILLARMRRRQVYPDSDDEFTSMSEDERSFLGRGAMRATRIFHISPPVHRFSEKPKPPPVDDSNFNRETIGLAISRPRSELASATIPQRPPSRLLPAKPTLTLTIPQGGSPPQQERTNQGQNQARESTMTVNTEFADLDSEAALTANRNTRGSIWRPPPTDPQSASTYYVADKWGNWVLGHSDRASNIGVAELDTYTPLTKSPIEKREEAVRKAQAILATDMLPTRPKPAFLAEDPAPIGISRSSSVYSQASAPRPLTSGSTSSAKVKRGMASLVDRSDSKMSHDSATTIATSSSEPFDDDQTVEPPPGHLSALSPVLEIPTPTGRSPVSYPKIPGRLDGTTLRSVPPPRRPDFYSPPGQPSPTLGIVMPSRVEGPLYPPPLNPRPRPQSRLPMGMDPTEKSGLSPVSPASPLQSRFSQQNPPQSPTPHLPPPRSQRRQSRQHIASQQIGSPMSATTTSSIASSLLAKRVGSNKAVGMSLEGAAKNGGQWRRQGGDNGLLSPDVIPGSARQRGHRAPLPATPTWQPRLTPTRRGDDLFLNVQ